jgi:haloacetate dehalogenase
MAMDRAEFEADLRREGYELREGEILELWRQRAEDVRGETLPSGHYVNEEAPRQMLDWFLRFFAS